ncbi:MAG: hypothetical protein AAGE83_00735, partial [Pseudomonadota bacterium]
MRPSSLMCGVCALALLSSIPSSGIAQSTDRLSTGIQAQVAVYRISVDARGVLRIAVPPGSSGSILIDGQRVLELNGQAGGVVEAMTTVDPGLHVVELRGALAADPGRISLARPGGAAEALTDAGSPETVSATASETSSGGQPIMSFGQRGASGSGGMRLSGLANDDGSGATGLFGSEVPRASNGDGVDQPEPTPGGLFGTRLVENDTGGAGGGNGGAGGGNGGGGGDGGAGGGDGGAGGGDGGAGGGDGGAGGGDGGAGGGEGGA